MGNLLVELGPERADKSLMLMAYAMTHPANRMPNPYAGELIEDAAGAHVRGRGVSEQKGSLAAALAAVKTAADRLAVARPSRVHGEHRWRDRPARRRDQHLRRNRVSRHASP